MDYSPLTDHERLKIAPAPGHKLKGWLIPFLASGLLCSAWAAGELDYFRACYGVWNYSLLGELGFDAVYQEVWWTEGAERALDKFATESLLAAAFNLSYICGPYYEVTVPDFEYTRAVNANGHTERGTPSRVDETYWRRLIHEPGIAIANLSHHYPIWGVVWDVEDYLREEFTYWDHTFDEPAIVRFANETGNPIPSLPPGEREGWLKSQGLLETFRQWQAETVEAMARDTRESMHAINPDLNLGILAFEDDSWFHLSILKGFTTEGRTVSAWHEDTYSGYKKGKIDSNHAVFAELGINGKVVPGLWSLWLSPFDLLNHMEFATRDNGAFWIYQRATNPWILGSEEDYALIFRVFRDQVWFDGSPEPKPTMEIYPGIEIRANLAGDRASAVLDEGTALKLGLFDANLDLPPDLPPITYMGQNLTIREISNGVLRAGDLPCFIWNLTEAELAALDAWSSIRELEELLAYYQETGLPGIDWTEAALDLSRRDFDDGRYAEVKSRLLNRMEDAFEEVMAQIWPLAEAGLGSPRNSTLPIPLLNRIYSAKKEFDWGNELEGRAYVMSALRQWVEIPEMSIALSRPWWLSITLLPGALLAHPVGKRREHAGLCEDPPIKAG